MVSDGRDEQAAARECGVITVLPCQGVVGQTKGSCQFPPKLALDFSSNLLFLHVPVSG